MGGGQLALTGASSCGGSFSPEPVSQHRDSVDSFCVLCFCWAAPWCHPGHPFALCSCIWMLMAPCRGLRGGKEWHFCCVFVFLAPHIHVGMLNSPDSRGWMCCCHRKLMAEVCFPQLPKRSPAPASAFPPHGSLTECTSIVSPLVQ